MPYFLEVSFIRRFSPARLETDNPFLLLGSLCPPLPRDRLCVCKRERGLGGEVIPKGWDPFVPPLPRDGLCVCKRERGLGGEVIPKQCDPFVPLSRARLVRCKGERGLWGEVIPKSALSCDRAIVSRIIGYPSLPFNAS